MSTADIVFAIPQELLPEAEVVVAVLQDAAKREANAGENEIRLVRTEARPWGPGEIGTVVMFVSGAAASWLTYRWLDTYVWPEVQKRIDAPSRKIVDFFIAELGLEKLPDEPRANP